MDDPRWHELVLPIFHRLPFGVAEIGEYLTRNALAWMEANEWAVFDPAKMIWEEHPKHLRERLEKEAKQNDFHPCP
jgi:hypothetical protein